MKPSRPLVSKMDLPQVEFFEPPEGSPWTTVFFTLLTMVVIGAIVAFVYFYTPYCRKGASKKQADSGKNSQIGENTPESVLDSFNITMSTASNKQ